MTELPRSGEGRRRRWTWCLAIALLLPAAILTPAQAARAGSGSVARALRPLLEAWGANGHGQLGNGNTTDQSLPVRARLPFATLVTGARAAQFSMAVTTTGIVYAWGDNSAGELGNATTTDSSTPVPVRLPAGVKVAAVRAGSKFALALTTTGQVLAWGSNSDGMLGNGKTGDSGLPVRVKLPKGVKVKAISTGAFFALALTTKGQILAWGSNRYGQLGDGTRTTRRTAVHVRLPRGTQAKSVSGGGAFALALTAAGRVLAWGRGAHGALGDGSTHDSRALVRVRLPGGTHVSSLFAGMSHSLALTRAGRILAWGADGTGQLGNGGTADRHLPVQVHLRSGVKVTAIAAGQDYSMAVTADGGLLAWGGNSRGQLGTGTKISTVLPVSLVLPLHTVAAIIGAGPVSRTSLAEFNPHLTP